MILTHNQLQTAVIEEFTPRFASEAKTLYLEDTGNNTFILDTASFGNLGGFVPSLDKLPDIVLYDEARNWLFLIEVVTSNGPISSKRRFELEEIFKWCSADRVYISAFPDFATLEDFVTEIAWETEVWLAEVPDHLIHFNGGRLSGPYN